MIVTFCSARKRLRSDVQILEEDLAALERHAAENRVARGRGLLIDLLEHEVLVAALLRRDRIPQHALRRLGDRLAVVVGELDARARDDGHLFIPEEHDIASMGEDGRDVGGDEEFVLTEADHDRRTVADGDDFFRVFERQQHDGEHAAHVGERTAHGVLQAVIAHLALHQVRDDLGVGFGLELVPLRLQLALQLEIVFDDAVVDDDDLAGAVAMRMGVLFGGTAMRRPACVADAVQAVDRFERIAFSRLISLPADRRSEMPSGLTTATPAES